MEWVWSGISQDDCYSRCFHTWRVNVIVSESIILWHFNATSRQAGRVCFFFARKTNDKWTKQYSCMLQEKTERSIQEVASNGRFLGSVVRCDGDGDDGLRLWIATSAGSTTFLLPMIIRLCSLCFRPFEKRSVVSPSLHAQWSETTLTRRSLSEEDSDVVDSIMDAHSWRSTVRGYTLADSVLSFIAFLFMAFTRWVASKSSRRSLEEAHHHECIRARYPTSKGSSHASIPLHSQRLRQKQAHGSFTLLTPCRRQVHHAILDISRHRRKSWRRHACCGESNRDLIIQDIQPDSGGFEIVTLLFPFCLSMLKHVNRTRGKADEYRIPSESNCSHCGGAPYWPHSWLLIFAERENNE